MADHGFGQGAEERRGKLRSVLSGALSREARQEAVRCGADGEGELQRLGIRPSDPERDRIRTVLIQPLSLVVKQDRIGARGGGERALGQADDRDRPEAKVLERVDVEDVDAAPREGAGPLAQDLVAAQVLDRRANGGDELLVSHLGAECVEASEPVEGVEDRAWILDVGAQQPGERGEVLGPGSSVGMVGEGVAEVLDELEE